MTAALTDAERSFWNAATKRSAMAPPTQTRAPDLLVERDDEAWLGAHLAAGLAPSGDVVYAENRVWRFADGTWEKLEDEVLTRRALAYRDWFVRVVREERQDSFRPLKLSFRAATGIVNVCKIQLHQPTFFSEAQSGAAFSNCFARVENGALTIEPLSRKHRVKREHAARFPLSERADRPETVDRLLREVWAGCPDLEARLCYFWEWLGAAICGLATRYKDTPLLVGRKDTGKSQVLVAIAACFPPASRRAVTLHAMAHEYQRAYLADGRINTVNELPARELLDGDAPKAILSGDPVVCRNPCEKPFEWTPRCAHVFAANELPPSRDAALLDRFVLLDCPNVVPREHQDRGLAARIEAEAPLIAAAALRALPALLARGHLIRPSSAEISAHEWRLQGDAVGTWAMECLAVSETTTRADVLYDAFGVWAAANGHNRMSSTLFGRRLGALGFDRIRSNGSWWQATITAR